MEVLDNIIEGLKEHNEIQVVASYANADLGGIEINRVLESVNNVFKVIPSLGRLRYLSFMKEAAFVIGNSSSGIIEAPILKKPVINIGERQNGRYQCQNIIQCNGSKSEIKEAIFSALNKVLKYDDYHYWGDGNTSKKILDILKYKIK